MCVLPFFVVVEKYMQKFFFVKTIEKNKLFDMRYGHGWIVWKQAKTWILYDVIE